MMTTKTPPLVVKTKVKDNVGKPEKKEYYSSKLITKPYLHSNAPNPNKSVKRVRSQPRFKQMRKK